MQPLGLRENDSVIPVKLVPAQAGNGNPCSSSFPTFVIGNPGYVSLNGYPPQTAGMTEGRDGYLAQTRRYDKSEMDARS